MWSVDALNSIRSVTELLQCAKKHPHSPPHRSQETCTEAQTYSSFFYWTGFLIMLKFCPIFPDSKQINSVFLMPYVTFISHTI